MAKGDVTMKFDAQTASFIQSVMHAKEAMELGANKTREFGEETVKAGDLAGQAMQKMGKTVVDSVGGIVTGIASIGAVISGAQQAVSAFFADMAAKAAKARQDLQSLAQTQAGGAAQGMSLAEFNKQVGALGGGLVAPEKARELLKSAYALGPKFSDEEKFAAAGAGVNYSFAYRGGKGAQQESAFMRTYAELARGAQAPGSNLPGTAEGLEGLADFISMYQGGLANEEDAREFLESPDKMKALARIVARNRSGEAQRGYRAIQTALIAGREGAGNLEFRKRMRQPHKLDVEGQRRARLVNLFEAGKLDEEAILADPTLVEARSQRAIAAFAAEYNPAAVEAAAGGQGFTGRMATSMKFYTTDVHGRQLARARDAAIAKERFDQRNAARAMQLENEQAEFDVGLRGAGVENSFLRGALGGVQKARQVRDEFQESFPGARMLRSLYPGNWVVDRMVNAMTAGPEVHEELKKQTELLQDLNENVQYKTREQRAMLNDNPGQQ